jgi:hypothetical protein
LKAKLFSVNAIADAFRKDRATVVRAMRGVRPDATEKGQPRYFWGTAVDALRAHEERNGFGRGGDDHDRRRLGEIADELEQTFSDLDAIREKIKGLPTLEAKQPHSRKGMKLVQRLDKLFEEANSILSRLDPHTLMPYVTDPLVGTEFRELLAAIWGRDMTIDGRPLFPPGYDDPADESDGNEVRNGQWPGRRLPRCSKAPI